MEFKNGMKYESVYERAAAYFIGTCAKAPVESNQLAAYKLIMGMYQLIAKDPAALGYKPIPDVSLDTWEKQVGREKDIKYIRGSIDKIEALIVELFNIAETAELQEDSFVLAEDMTLSRALKKAFCSLGVIVSEDEGKIILTGKAGCFESLKELAVTSRNKTVNLMPGPKGAKPYLYFSRCVFEPEKNWTVEGFDHFLGAEGRLVHLCNELEKRGYQRVDCIEGQKVGLDYVKQYGKKQEPLKLAWAERTHAGISLTFEELRLEPCFLWMRIPMYKTILEHINEMPQNVKEFVKMFTKTCDGCRYCVQTDKTKTRPLACIKVDEQKKCPLYPGYYMCWRELPQRLEDAILDFLEAINQLLG